MKEIIRKGFLIGIGLSSLAKEKAEKIANDLVRRGKLSEKEGKELARKLIATLSSEKQIASKEIGKALEKSVNAILGVTKREVKRLSEEVKKALEQKKAKPKKGKK